MLAAVVAVGCTLGGWLQAPDELTASEAVDAAADAFGAAGLDDVDIDPDPVTGTYSPGGDDARVPVWLMSATYQGGTISLWIGRDDGEALYLDDRTPDGAAQLLTDEQVQAIADHDGSPAVARQVRRNLVVTVAAALVLALALRHARVGSSAMRHPSSPPPVPAAKEPPDDRARSPRPGRPLVAAQRPPR